VLHHAPLTAILVSAGHPAAAPNASGGAALRR
jgi:hypothetical protein